MQSSFEPLAVHTTCSANISALCLYCVCNSDGEGLKANQVGDIGSVSRNEMVLEEEASKFGFLTSSWRTLIGALVGLMRP